MLYRILYHIILYCAINTFRLVDGFKEGKKITGICMDLVVTALTSLYLSPQLLKSRSDAELGQAASCSPAVLPHASGGASSKVGTSILQV